MIPILINSNIATQLPELRLGCIECTVAVREENTDLWQEINDTLVELKQTLAPDMISKLPAIQASRKAYKTLGKDPSRYRLSAEALLRRVVKRKGIYKINNIVDLLNLVSVKSGFSIAGYDTHKIDGTITLGVGQKHEPFQAIGRGELNIENLPVFRDNQGAIGSPTSDAVRTCVTPSTTRFLMIIYDFGSHKSLKETMSLALDLLTRFGAGSEFEQFVLSS